MPHGIFSQRPAIHDRSARSSHSRARAPQPEPVGLVNPLEFKLDAKWGGFTMSTLSGALVRAARLFANNVAAINEHGSLNWPAVLQRVRHVAGALVANGLGAGSTYAVISANSHDFAEILFAGLWMGAIPVPINPRFAPPEITAILQAADVQLVAGGDLLDDVMDKLPQRFAALPRLALDDHRFGEWPFAYAPVTRHEALPSDVALIYFTSGTQGRPKGVPLSHQQILVNMMQVNLSWPRQPGAVCLHVAPMFHSADLLMFSSVIDGAANAYLSGFSPASFRDAVARFGVTDTMLVPSMIGMLLRGSDGREAQLASLLRLIYGASSMPTDRIAALMQSLPKLKITQGYGLSETAPLLTMLSHSDHVAAVSGKAPQWLQSCGQALTGIELRIVDDNGHELRPHQHGEVQARGPNVFSGYLHDEEETLGSFDGDWFRTGDLGYQDDTGHLYILERKKNVIKRGGEKILPAEVENIINDHPAVVECAVIALPGRAYEDIIVAVLVTRDNRVLDSGDIRAHCEGRIAKFKIPRRVICIDELPRNSVGKVTRYVLTARYSTQSDD